MKSPGYPVFSPNFPPRRSPRFLPVVREIEVVSSIPKIPSSVENRNGNLRRSSRLSSTANFGLGNGECLVEETQEGKSRRGSRVSTTFIVKTPSYGEPKKKTGDVILSYQNLQRSPRFSVAAASRASSEVGIAPRRSSRLAEEAARKSELERSSGNDDARGNGWREPVKKVEVVKRKPAKKVEVTEKKETKNCCLTPVRKKRRATIGVAMKKCKAQLEEEEYNKIELDKPTVAEKETKNSCVTPVGKKRRATIGVVAKKNCKAQLEEDNKIELDKPVVAKVACGAVDWTNEQSNALHIAYTVAKPSPHFWKKVSKMVPGKSAKECFDRIHSKYPTPPRPVMRRKSVSPLRNFNILDGKNPQKITKSDKQRFLAHKIARQILRKHTLTDHQQGQDSDLFSVFETAKLSSICRHNSDSEEDRIEDALPTVFVDTVEEKKASPEVLKPVRNLKLHEKYIDQLLHRNMKQKAKVKKVDGDCKENDIVATKELLVRSAKDNLLSDAREAIGQYHHHTQVDMQRRYLGCIEKDCDDD